MKKALKIFLYGLLGLVVFLCLLAAFTQTQFFRDRLRNTAVSQLDFLLDANVQIGEITGNLIEGFAIQNVSIKVRDDYFVSMERIDLRYDLFQVPSKRIAVKELVLVKPRIALIRGRDSVWNFIRMVRPTPEDTAAKKPFDWPIVVGRLEIREGTISLVDSAALASADHPPRDSYFVEYHQFTLTNLNLITSAMITPAMTAATVSSLSFISDQPDVRLVKLSGELSVNSKEARVKDLLIKTGRSELRLSASLGGIDLFSGLRLEKLRQCPATVALQAHELDLNELKRFIPPIDFLNGVVTADIQVDGEFGEMNVKRLDLKTGNTQMRMKGLVANLHNPGELFLSVKCTESEVDYADVLKLLPSFHLPDYRNLGLSTINLEYTGKPLDFQAKGYVESSSGKVKIDGGMKIGGADRLAYKWDVVTRELDLGALLHSAKLASRLNGRVSIQGKGIALDRLDAKLSVRLDSSEFMGQRVGRTDVELVAANRSFEGRAAVAIGTTRADLIGKLSMPFDALPTYSAEGRLTSLNVQQFLRGHPNSSNISLSLRAAGAGISLDKLTAELQVHFDSSRYGEYVIDSAGYVAVKINQEDPRKKEIKLESRLVDLTLTGAFDLHYLTKLISFESQNILSAVGAKFRSLDSTIASSVDPEALLMLRKELGAAAETLNVEYVLGVKNVEPLSLVTSVRRFNGGGVLAGSIKGGYNNLAVDGALILDAFFYGTADSGILVQDAMVAFDAKNLVPDSPLETLEFGVSASATTLHLNRTELDSVTLTAQFIRNSSDYAFSTRYNRVLSLQLEGESNIVRDEAVFMLHKLIVGYRDFVWKTDSGAIAAFGAHTIRVKDFVVRRNGESVTANGVISQGRALNATVTGKNIDLVSLKYILPREEGGSQHSGFEGLADIVATASGTFDAPTYAASLRIADVFYRTVPFGRVRGDFAYKDEVLKVTAEIDNRADTTTGRPDLRVEGILPLNLALTAVPQRVPDKPMDFRMYSEGVQMSMLDPLLPTFNNLQGTLRANVRMQGSPKTPDFSGSLNFDNCSFLFVPNNMYYHLDAEVKPEGERIKVVKATVKNVQSDNRQGREGVAYIAGDFALRNFVPSEFSLSGSGALLVVSKTTRRSSLAVFGDLFVEIKPEGLRFTGEVDNSLLKGYVLVRNSNLIFPPTQAAVQQESPFAIPVKVVDDTTRASAPKQRSLTALYFASGNDSLRRTAKTVDNELPTRSFIEGLRYDLNLESSGGNTEIQMIFNPATNEELVASIAGNATITEDGKHWVGRLNVERAYYNFYGKKFEAEGTMTYSGDFLNPELDITAQYQGQRTIADSIKKTDVTERIVVTNKVSGQRSRPKLEMSMTINDVDYASYRGSKSGDVQSDAIAFIMSGDFPLTRGQQTNLASQVTGTLQSTLGSGATSLLTGALSDLLRDQLGFLKSVELRYGSGTSFSERADIRVSGTLFKGLWRYGGKILDDPFTNANLSVLYSFGDIFERPALRNFMFEVERRVDFGALGLTNDRKEVNSARLFYRFSF